MNEHVIRILSLNYKTHLVEFVTPTCLVGSLEVKIILIMIRQMCYSFRQLF